MQSLDSSYALLYSTAEDIARRLIKEGRPTMSMTSVLELIDNDETELALDELVRIIEYFCIPIMQEEYNCLISAATRLDSMDSLLETGIERFVIT